MEKAEKLYKKIKKLKQKGELSEKQLALTKEFLKLDTASFKKSKCIHCAAPVVVHQHTLLFGTVKAIADIAKTKGFLKRFKLSNTTEDRNVLDNFQKLRYFGLCQKEVSRKNGVSIWSSTNAVSKKGVWRLTLKAKKFLTGESLIESAAYTFRGKVIWSEGEVSIKSQFASWKNSKDYAKDKQPLVKFIKEHFLE